MELFDKDFSKPQAFQRYPVSRSGGIAVIISFKYFFIIYNLLYSEILYDYIFIGYLFLVGFLDDLKTHIKPSVRLLLMISILFVIIYFFGDQDF